MANRRERFVPVRSGRTRAIPAAALVFLAFAAQLTAQATASAPAPAPAPSITGPVDPLRFSQLKDFEAFRESSNNADPNSNDDSQHPIAGQTITIADLTGPGIVTHIWITVAASEYGWPRLLRLRVYYD